ncbi:hypothetical protein CEE45_03165 [Candidatus Heimdallarchaeota archaeon B3_Heim]|nr:MAG: hypothetical protein CEE45_03165 [Candidatus Heimdallarchaeota archaeon B3_Heim]
MKRHNSLKGIHSIKTRIRTKRRGSPLVEEGILIGLSLFGFLLIFSIVTGVLDWLLINADELLRELGSLFA